MSTAQTDTIVAIATPPGRSGIGIVRLSGHNSLPILRSLVGSQSFDPRPNVLTLRNIFDPENGDVIDQALVCYFKKPHSFTGEDVVEIHAHGSPILLRAIVDASLHLDARMAEPGEFSLRSVANGRMQLSEAEAVRDLINAQTDEAVKQASRQMKGEVSKTLQPLKDELLRIIVRFESALEFVEDDLEPVAQHEISTALASVEVACARLTQTFSRGHLLNDGIRVTLLGRPNVGKSSLFNCLLGRARAIVTEIPGTTRDAIAESISIDGVPIILTDTAGLRVAVDQIEAIGVDRTKREAADSDLLIVVIDGSSELTSEDHSVLLEVADTQHLVAINKSDMPSFVDTRLDSFTVNRELCSVVPVSAKTGDGIEALRAGIIQRFTSGVFDAQGLLITNARHYDLLVRTIESIRSAQDAMRAHASEEVVLIDLHNALGFLGEITGETTSDEILGQIFSTFCIGK